MMQLMEEQVGTMKRRTEVMIKRISVAVSPGRCAAVLDACNESH